MLNWWNHTPPPQRLAVLMSIGRGVCIVFGDELCGTAQLVKKVAYLLGAMTPKLSASGLPKEIRYIMCMKKNSPFITLLTAKSILYEIPKKI